MLIQKDERVSRAMPSRRPDWDGGSRRRPPRNWFKIVRVTLYALIGTLAGLAALAAIALFLAPPPAAPPAPAPTADAAPTQPPDAAATAPPETPPLPASAAPEPAAPAAPPPAAVADMPAAPAPAPVASAAPATEPAPAAAAPAPALAVDPQDAGAVTALREQLRDAASALSGLRSETDALRGALAEARRHQADIASHPRPAPVPAAAPAAAPATAAAARPTPDAAWQDAERTIQTLARHPAEDAAAPSATAAPPPPAPAPAPAATAELAANAPLPAPAPNAPRPRVYLHYAAGSAGAMRQATDVAQRLLFSDFAYADTRSTVSAPTDSVIRYFYAEDAPAAERLAALLSDGGTGFRIQDAHASRGRAKPGTLDVWIGR